MPRVSVIMGVYNTKRYVAEAIESVLKQTYKDFEFIIIDDTSTDGTSEILQKYAKKDKRIKLIKNKTNLGLTKNLNVGLRKAKGEFIARMDADDVSLPNRFATEVQFLDKHPDVALAGTWADIINNEGKIIGEIKYTTEHKQIRRNMTERSQIIHPSVMFRKRIVNEVGMYDEKLRTAQDYEYFARVMSKFKVANIPKKLLHYRWDFSQNEGFKKNRQQEINGWVGRWRMFTKYGWPAWYIIFAIKPAIAFCIPSPWRLWVVKKFYRK
jgi:glycosyltransferase involved in cell wall biosynthesis